MKCTDYLEDAIERAFKRITAAEETNCAQIQRIELKYLAAMQQAFIDHYEAGREVHGKEQVEEVAQMIDLMKQSKQEVMRNLAKLSGS